MSLLLAMMLVLTQVSDAETTCQPMTLRIDVVDDAGAPHKGRAWLDGHLLGHVPGSYAATTCAQVLKVSALGFRTARIRLDALRPGDNHVVVKLRATTSPAAPAAPPADEDAMDDQDDDDDDASATEKIEEHPAAGWITGAMVIGTTVLFIVGAGLLMLALPGIAVSVAFAALAPGVPFLVVSAVTAMLIGLSLVSVGSGAAIVATGLFLRGTKYWSTEVELRIVEVLVPCFTQVGAQCCLSILQSCCRF